MPDSSSDSYDDDEPQSKKRKIEQLGTFRDVLVQWVESNKDRITPAMTAKFERNGVNFEKKMRLLKSKEQLRRRWTKLRAAEGKYSAKMDACYSEYTTLFEKRQSIREEQKALQREREAFFLERGDPNGQQRVAGNIFSLSHEGSVQIAHGQRNIVNVQGNVDSVIVQGTNNTVVVYGAVNNLNVQGPSNSTVVSGNVVTSNSQIGRQSDCQSNTQNLTQVVGA